LIDRLNWFFRGKNEEKRENAGRFFYLAVGGADFSPKTDKNTRRQTFHGIGVWLFFVFARGTVFTAHTVGGGAAVHAFVGAVAVDVLPGGGLEASVPVGRRAAVNAVFFIVVVFVKPVQAFRASGAIGG
jgi:hypothetical protein